jgi:RNA polymerase sigma-70 factor (ECF subfamily)
MRTEMMKSDPEDLVSNQSASDGALAADALLVRQLRCGDADAGHRFVRDYYPGIYRYLLYLTGRPETAEDLTQETFLKAWRGLDRFVVRAPLRAWLYRIAHREFLQALRRQRPELALAESADPPAPYAAEQMESVELRELIRTLPVEEREMIILHYLHGYTCEEIASIVRAPVSTVKYRLLKARAHLERELGEGDMAYLNEPGIPGTRIAGGRRWAWLPLDQMSALEARLPMFEGEQKMTDKPRAGMSRRKLLESAGTAAAVAAAGLAGRAEAAAPRNEAEITDERLTRKVTLALKATALADVCAQLQSNTGVHLTANSSVADEKVTLFCEKRPLREVMRQLSRPFGYTWLRSQPVDVSRQSAVAGPKSEGSQDQPPTTVYRLPTTAYRYELAQDLRSQLLEEELRNRDRNEALLALEREIEKYRPYLDLSPDEARERARTAPPEEKAVLETLSGKGWGDIQMYFRLSPADLAALRAGETVTFSAAPKPGEQPLPEDVARGVLQTWQDWRIAKRGDHFEFDEAERIPDGLPPTMVPEVRARVTLKLDQSELGTFTINNSRAGFTIGESTSMISGFELATGTSPAVRSPGNAVVNARLARDPALAARVTVRPEVGSGLSAVGQRPSGTAASPSPTADSRQPTALKLTTADLLEVLHRATGMSIVADFYTRLYDAEGLMVHDQPLFAALNQLADAMRLRWTIDAGAAGERAPWLQFRSISFYDDRLKEVPNHLLSRWSAARRKQGFLTLDDLIEIAQLSDAQLDGENMAEGARELWGLAEWDIARGSNLRPHLRFLASLTLGQRQEAMSPSGLAFSRMSLAQQQQFIAVGIGKAAESLQSLQELSDAALHVDYTLPGWFQWHPPEDLSGPGWPPLRPAPARERTREAALQPARRLDPQVTEAQITPTEQDLAVIYTWGGPKSRDVRWIRPNGQWGRRLNNPEG